MFNNNRYITKGVQSEIPAGLQFFMWNCISAVSSYAQTASHAIQRLVSVVAQLYGTQTLMEMTIPHFAVTATKITIPAVQNVTL